MLSLITVFEQGDKFSAGKIFAKATAETFCPYIASCSGKQPYESGKSLIRSYTFKFLAFYNFENTRQRNGIVLSVSQFFQFKVVKTKQKE